jgi:hypothetical protein
VPTSAPTDLATRRVLTAFTARVANELPDVARLIRQVVTGPSPTGGDDLTEAQVIADGVPVLVELGVPGVTVAAEQLEEGTLVLVRMAPPDDEVAVPRQGDELHVVVSAGLPVANPVPIRVLGVAWPRSYATLVLVTGRQVRG